MNTKVYFVNYNQEGYEEGTLQYVEVLRLRNFQTLMLQLVLNEHLKVQFFSETHDSQFQV